MDVNKMLRNLGRASKIIESNMSSMNTIINDGINSFEDKDTRDKLESLVSDIRENGNSIDVKHFTEQANKIVADANTDTSN